MKLKYTTNNDTKVNSTLHSRKVALSDKPIGSNTMGITKPIDPQILYLPGLRIPGYSKSVFNEKRDVRKDQIGTELSGSLLSIKSYLLEVNGVFSKSHYSEILKPKSSTLSTVAGVSRDKHRSILTKLANQFNKGGKQRTAIKSVNSAFVFIHSAIKMDRSIDRFISISNSFRQLWYLNPSFNRAPFPFLSKILDFVNHATPKFCIKRHINKGHGRRKKAKKGAPKLRSYLAFLSPHGRRVMSFKWLMLDYYKISKGHKFKKNLYFFILNSLMGLEDNAAVTRKIELYKEVVAYLRKRN